MKKLMIVMAAGLMLAGCDPLKTPRVEALDAKAWDASEWISVASAPVAGEAERKHQRAADGTSVFRYRHVNAKDVKSAKWMTAGLGVYGLYLNGGFPIGKDFLKPGFTHGLKTKRSFTYDITAPLRKGRGEANDFGVEVSAGWWRDQIVRYVGKKSAFRGVIEFTYVDGTTELVGTKASEWYGCIAGPVMHAGIFDGEEYDARKEANCARQPQGDFVPGGCERNDEFQGEILPTDGAEICLRCDLAHAPVAAYRWKGVEGGNSAKEPKDRVFGKVIRTKTFAPDDELEVVPGEQLVVDFGQNCAAVPALEMSAAADTVLTILPGEMLNDGNGRRSRGNDGPEGSLYRENLRIPNDGMRAVYTFADTKGGMVRWCPTFTFFGFRYVSMTATARVVIRRIRSVPVTSVTKEMEIGSIETGDKALNRFIANVYWGQLSNYLSVPTDCPQRNERLGWTADTQVFAEAGAFNANTCGFFHKWLRDLRDNQGPEGGYPGVAPSGQYGNETMRVGWADAGVIVPYVIWRQFGDMSIIEESWASMERFMDRVNATKYDTVANAKCNRTYQWADWLSLTKNESCPYKPEFSGFESVNGKRSPKKETLLWWNYLCACYWAWDADLMAAMARATGNASGVAKYVRMAADARAFIRETYFKTDDGLIRSEFRDMQTANIFALKLGLVEGAAKAKTLEILVKSIADNGGTLHTGFLGTSVVMDTLADNGRADVAYSLLLNHKFPGWLYSVDQGATTVWERWNGYTVKDGFGPVGMNSFNHYAYGAVLAWIYRTAAGIAADETRPGFRNIIMKPVPDRRLGFVKAEYKSAAGLVRSAWKYEGEKWVWDFTVPEGATASVTLPGETAARPYAAGTYHIER